MARQDQRKKQKQNILLFAQAVCSSFSPKALGVNRYG